MSNLKENKPVILIVEDEVITALYLEMILKKEGFNVLKPVGTGDKAILAARKSYPDVVLMDIGLAGKMDGIEAARKIYDFCKCHIIFMSGYQDSISNIQREFMSCSFLVKPVNPQEIIKEIKKDITISI